MAAVEFTQVVSHGCGMDIHKEVVVATVRGEGIQKETRSFDSFTSSLTELREWLVSLGITHVAMESTGVYWKPIYNVFEGHIPHVWIVNARHIKNVPGHKTDKNDSEWICQLLLQRIRECYRKLTVEIAELDRRIKEIVAPYAEVMERLDEIPGLHDRTLEDLIAEIGLDMTAWDTQSARPYTTSSPQADATMSWESSMCQARLKRSGRTISRASCRNSDMRCPSSRRKISLLSIK